MEFSRKTATLRWAEGSELKEIPIRPPFIETKIWTGDESTFTLKSEELGVIIHETESGRPLGTPSAGHQEIAALAFLASAYKVAGNKNPFIFDYIFARLDENRQVNLLKHLPEMGHQFIISVLTSEPNWDNNPELFNKVNNNLNKKYELEYDEEYPNSRVRIKEIN